MNGESSHSKSMRLSVLLPVHSNPFSASYTETDDDFGIADFDDADFGEGHAGHPDEVVLPADDLRSSRTTNGTTYQPLQPSVPNSAMTETRMTTPSRPPNARQNAATAAAAAARIEAAGPRTTSNPYPGMQPPTSHIPQSHPGHNRPPPLNDQQQSSNDAHQSSSPGISSQHFAPQPPHQQSLPSNAPRQIPSIGFYSARAAPVVNSDSSAAATSTIPKFDPHAESPSIRKQWTAGIDHNKTIPVKRGLAGATVIAAPAVRDGVSPRANPPRDFVNPSADLHRRIGAPGAGLQSQGGVTGSAYRPPTRLGPDPSITGGGAAQNSSTLRRAPLGDVSNIQQSTTGSTDGNDAKRQRVTGPENGLDGCHPADAR